MEDSLEEQRLNTLLSAARKLASESVLNNLEAQLFSRGVVEDWKGEKISWTSDLSVEFINKAYNLVVLAQTLRELGESQYSNQCFRKAGRYLEWLFRAGDDYIHHLPLKVMGAAAFQLGGLPGLASAMMNSNKIDSGDSEIYKAFLSADFFQTIKNCNTFWEKEEQGNMVYDELITSLVSSIGVISASIIDQDDDRVLSAFEKLEALSKFCLRSSNKTNWLLVSLIYEVGKHFSENSITNISSKIRDSLSEAGKLKFNSYSKKLIKKGRSVLWQSQTAAIPFLESDCSFALCTPTGSGKTLIGTISLLQSLYKNEDLDYYVSPLVIYLVPSRALCIEVETALQRDLKGRGIIITGLYSGADWSVTESWVTSDKPTVLICTVEKAEALLRSSYNWLAARTKCILIDEAHQVEFSSSDYSVKRLLHQEERSFRLESFVSRLISRNQNIKRIALTAVAGQGNEDSIAKWISSGENDTAVGSKLRSSRQLLGRAISSTSGAGQIEILSLNNTPLELTSGKSPFIPLRFGAIPKLTKTFSESVYAFNDAYSFWLAINFAAIDHKVLISVPSKIETMLGRVSSLLKSRSWKERGTPEFFDIKLYENDEEFQKCLAAIESYCGKNSLELKLFKSGIASHHGQLPPPVRRPLTRLIERGVFPITIATSTLTEGVNLPFDIIILSKTFREFYDQEKKEHRQERLSIKEFKNLIGRAGRPGVSQKFEGLAILCVPEEPVTSSRKKRDIYQQNSQIKNLKNHADSLIESFLSPAKLEPETDSSLSKLLEVIRLLSKNILNTESDDIFLDWLENVTVPSLKESESQDIHLLAEGIDCLDQFLLSAIQETEIIREFDSNVELEEQLKNLWNHTYANIVSVNKEKLEKIIKVRGEALHNIHYPDVEVRKRIYNFGFAPSKAVKFQQYVQQFEEVFRLGKGYESWGVSQRISYFSDLIEIIREDSDFGFKVYDTKLEKSLSENWNNTLSWWLGNKEAIPPKPNELRKWLKFCSENFEYRFGSALGAVISNMWVEKSGGFDLPLDASSWESQMDLPWVVFWLRELIKWGTLEPLVSYLMSSGEVSNRDGNDSLIAEYTNWALENSISNESLISPLNFKKWEISRYTSSDSSTKAESACKSLIIRPDFKKEIDKKISLYPYHKANDDVIWFDRAGYDVAASKQVDDEFHDLHSKSYYIDLKSKKIYSTKR